MAESGGNEAATSTSAEVISETTSLLHRVKDVKDVKAPNLIERAKEEIEAMIHHDKKPQHHKETHGTSDDIDESTPIDEVKGPNVFERVKEEIEAVVQSIHPKKLSNSC